MASRIASVSPEEKQKIREAWLNPKLRVGDILDMIHEEIDREITFREATIKEEVEEEEGREEEDGQKEGLLTGNEVRYHLSLYFVYWKGGISVE